MIMTTIDDKTQELLGALQELGGGWRDRDEIARALGKKQRTNKKPQLSALDIAALDILASQGKIEKSTIPTRRPHILRSVYRIKE
jgi:hypothetical protein